jgi:hypothetical protein
MKSSILLLAFAVLAFSSCTTAYKSGQTPDDVYYSPAREQDEYVVVDKKEDHSYAGSEEYYEDRYLRYRTRSPYRWSALDDYYYNPSYAWQYGGYTSWSNPYSSYHCWNNYYNPYYGGGIIITKPVYNYRPPSRPIAFNPGSYNSGGGNTKSVFSGSKYGGSGISGTRYNNGNGSRYNNSNGSSNRNSSSFGNSVRRVFSNDNNSNGRSSRSDNNSNSTPSRSYTPSTSSSSSSSGGSSSGGSSGGSVSRPGR